MVLTEEPRRRREARTSSAGRAEKPIPWGRERGEQGRPLSQREDLGDHITETSWGLREGRTLPPSYSVFIGFNHHAPHSMFNSPDPLSPFSGAIDLARANTRQPGGAVKEGKNPTHHRMPQEHTILCYQSPRNSASSRPRPRRDRVARGREGSGSGGFEVSGCKRLKGELYPGFLKRALLEQFALEATGDLRFQRRLLSTGWWSPPHRPATSRG
jgi:hypothetical protein